MKIAIEKTIDKIEDVNKLLNWLDGTVCKALEKGAVSVGVGRPDLEEEKRISEDEEKRTPDQNAKLWAIFTDFEWQLVWHGQKMTKEDWKDLLCHEWQNQKLIPAISGGFCVLNARTSKANKRQISDLIEICHAFGSSHNIKWSEPALKVYEEYRQAK